VDSLIPTLSVRPVKLVNSRVNFFDRYAPDVLRDSFASFETVRNNNPFLSGTASGIVN
jgi:hypothetical protein